MEKMMMNEYQEIFNKHLLETSNLNFDELNLKVLSCFDVEEYEELVKHMFTMYSLSDILSDEWSLSELFIETYIGKEDKNEFISEWGCEINHKDSIIKIEIKFLYDDEDTNEFKPILEDLPLFEKLRKLGFKINFEYSFSI